MSGHRSWDELVDRDSEAYRQAKRELDECWEVVCRYGNCVCFVHPDKGDTGGWGPVGCPCENPGWRWVKRNEDKPHRCPECHAIAAWDRKTAGPRTRLKCPSGCRVQWRYARRLTQRTTQRLKRYEMFARQQGWWRE